MKNPTSPKNQTLSVLRQEGLVLTLGQGADKCTNIPQTIWLEPTVEMTCLSDNYVGNRTLAVNVLNAFFPGTQIKAAIGNFSQALEKLIDPFIDELVRLVDEDNAIHLTYNELLSWLKSVEHVESAEVLMLHTDTQTEPYSSTISNDVENDNNRAVTI